MSKNFLGSIIVHILLLLIGQCVQGTAILYSVGPRGSGGPSRSRPPRDLVVQQSLLIQSAAVTVTPSGTGKSVTIGDSHSIHLS